MKFLRFIRETLQVRGRTISYKPVPTQGC
jgi:hypothetical protein